MKQVLIILIPVILLSVFMAGGFTKSPIKNRVSLAGVFELEEKTGIDTKNVLQIQNLVAKPTATPTPGPIDFSASTLDWEDVKALLVKNNLLSGLGSCIDELNRAVKDEVGVSEDIKPPASDSRIGLCWQSRKCIEQGYSAYDGSVDLPRTVISPACQEALRNAFQQIVPPSLPAKPPVGSEEAVYYDVFNNKNTNCDYSDLICVSLAQFCARLRYPIYSSFLSICP